ncbi:hypothetical protein L873DRAFT_1831215 [Choiromyces venosus 120613-1]|uniref:Uncharacterized protein n=1 Tax=Choiromyces venosus 120613-1 TaxID=1336337 RepID=A0A3N4J1Z9_9PEZI|nr:hypothetical protein L873DRAFT_1831215 [Choiromyces venosus 120613-1]
MSTLLAPPAVLFPTKSPTDWSEASTTDTSSTSSTSTSAATPAHAPMASTAADTMSGGSRGIPMQTASTQTDSEGLRRDISPAANRASDTNYLQGRAEESGQGSDLDSPYPKPKQGAASHYLRKAEAHESPRFGNVGLSNPEAASAAASSLAHTSAKPVETRKTDPISAAGAAASLAHANSRIVEPWRPAQGTGAEKAASHALEDSNDRLMQASRTGPSSTLQHESGAKISGNALTAASLAHMPTVRRASNAVEPAFERLVENDFNNAGGVSQQERRKSDILRAATISMAKRNRDIHPPDSPSQRHRVPFPGRQHPATTSPSSRHPIYGPDLNEAARKAAAERLALIGYPPKRSVSLSGTKGAQVSLNRSRSVTAESTTASDHGRTRRTDGNPSRSHDNLTRLENKRRGENAVLLMTAAQRNVQAQMSGLDRQIADSKGLVCREDQEARAREMAQVGHDKRQHQNHDAIAERNVRPVLDDMNRKAEAGRARVSAEKARAIEERIELEEKKRLQEVQRAWEKETQEEIKRAKAMEKQEEKRRKEEEKRRLKERRQSFKMGSKRAKDSNSDSQQPPPPPPAPIVSNSNGYAAPITPPTSPKEEKGLRGLINKFRARRHSRNASRSSTSKELFTTGGSVTTGNNNGYTAGTGNYYNTAPSRYSNIPPPPSALQTNGIGSPTTTTTPTLTEIALLGAPPPATTTRRNPPPPPPLPPPHTGSPVSSMHSSFQCRGESVPEVHISDNDNDDHYHNPRHQERRREDMANHSDNSEEERDTFPTATASAQAPVVLNQEQQLPLEREVSPAAAAGGGEAGNRSSVGSKFFENL